MNFYTIIFMLDITATLFGTYLFIFLMTRAIIEKKKSDVELLHAKMKFQAFQERQDALYAYHQEGRR